MITISAYSAVPPVAQGLVRDLRVRWALEEAGLPYEARLLGWGEQKSPAYRARQPFGQVPVYEEDGLLLFETGAILLHIGARCEALLPADPAARARACSWVFAALNSVEPLVQRLFELDVFYAGQDWVAAHRPAIATRARERLGDLAEALGEKDYLEGRFTAGDLMMTTVLRMLRVNDLLADRPQLAAYQARCEARPAFQRALRDQMASYAA